MIQKVIVLTGRVGSGKSDLSAALHDRFGCHICKTNEYIRRLSSSDLERHSMQEAGSQLDRDTGGKWLSKEVSKDAVKANATLVVVDSARIKEQIDGLRTQFPDRVVHIHLKASDKELARRYMSRVSKFRELKSYKEVGRDPTEAQVDSLEAVADIAINTERCEPHDVVALVANRVGLYGHGNARLVDVVVGGQYGSEGKGQIVAHLSPEYDFLVRVGGPNAGHKVYKLPEPYTFRTVPSGTLRAEKAKVVLGPGAVIKVDILEREVDECGLGIDRLFIDPQAMIIESWDSSSEDGLRKSIGSTGQGVGFATARKVLRGHFPGRKVPQVRLAKDIPSLKHFIHRTREVLDDAFRSNSRILLEGTQGTGLSVHHGDYPKVTSRDTTASGCLAEAGISPMRVRKIIMVCRTYPIRVGGNSGPMGRVIDWGIVSKRSGLSKALLEKTERGSVSGTLRRVSEFSWSQLQRASALNMPTDIALTFADYIRKENQDARRYEQLTPETVQFIEDVERVAKAPVSLIATRFHFRSIIDRRHW